MQPSTSAPRSPSLATPAPAVVAAVTVDVFAPWWRRRALTPPATDDATGNTAAVAGNVAAAGTARFLETLIERADCRCGTSTLCSTTTLQSTDQECPFIEKLCWRRRPQSVATTLSPPAPMRHGQSSDIEIFSPGGRKCGDGGAKWCCDRKYELLRAYDALPAFLKHNEFIIDYYRSEWPIKQALLSAFVVHNETIFQT
uniref:Uncharacterized protein n=1 Tax=Oryza rufipogon TaxID=4529 RepID=A0A0E0NWX7_ORYRU